MCCIFAALFALGPRAAIFIWWLIEPLRWQSAFDTVILPIVGFFILPWTTLMWLVVAPGGIDTLDWVWITIAVAMDVFSWFGGAFTNRGRLAQAR